jgi:hypothetical protein
LRLVTGLDRGLQTLLPMTMSSRRTLLLAVTTLVLGGCGGSDEAPVAAEVDLVECDAPLCLTPPSEGFQIETRGTTIEPGQDAEYCEIVRLPGDASDAYHVNVFETEMTNGSHHLIVDAVEPGSEMEASLEEGQVIPCIGAFQLGDETKPVTGAQLPTHVDSFPEGVGRTFQGGQLLVVDYHYLNPYQEPLEAKVRINFHTVDASRVTKEARAFGFYNFGIEIPPKQEASFVTECTFSEDVYVYKLTRHTHQWGKDFNVWYAGGERDGDLLFASEYYEDVDHVFDEPLLVPAGDGFRFECSYFNDEDYTLKFGVKATDEMCILFGTWWEATDGHAPGQSCFVYE